MRTPARHARPSARTAAGVGAQRRPGAAGLHPRRPGARRHRAVAAGWAWARAPPTGWSRRSRPSGCWSRTPRPAGTGSGSRSTSSGRTVTEHVDLHQAALPVLTTLRHATGEMVHVAVLDGLEVVYVERLESHHMLPIFRRVGHRLPAHWTSSGKVLLAALPRPELEPAAPGWQPMARTPRTITDPRAAAGRARAGGQARLGAPTSRRATWASSRSARRSAAATARCIAAVSPWSARANRMQGTTLRRHTQAVLLESAAAIAGGWARAPSPRPRRVARQLSDAAVPTGVEGEHGRRAAGRPPGRAAARPPRRPRRPSAAGRGSSPRGNPPTPRRRAGRARRPRPPRCVAAAGCRPGPG